VPIAPIKKAKTAANTNPPGGESEQTNDYIGQRQGNKVGANEVATISDQLTSNGSSNASSTALEANVPNLNPFLGVTSQNKVIKAQERLKVEIPAYEPAKHEANAVRVIAPSDPTRLRFITIVSSFVAKDGSVLEKKIIERESNNPAFSFMMPLQQGTTQNLDQVSLNERIFYRWRVFTFTQGDGFDSWRTDPFMMIEGGRFWIPPSLDAEAALREEMKAKQKEEHIKNQQEVRRQLAGKKGYMTGRQLEHAKFGGSRTAASDGAIVLNKYEMDQWKDIMENKLCASNEAISEAMAFCFDKSGAAKQISELLRDALMDDSTLLVETRVARLYLVSDILFNSQQPGVKNAFRYRDAIEAMAPDVFRSFGQHGQGYAGRMTMNKVRNAVRAVLSAWASWSVYNVTFLDELQANFEGVELAPSLTEKEDVPNDTVGISTDEKREQSIPMAEDPEVKEVEDVQAPRSQWVEAKDLEISQPLSVQGEDINNNDLSTNKEDVGDDDVMGDEELDGEALSEDDIDGEDLDDGDLDGVTLSDDDMVEIPAENI